MPLAATSDDNFHSGSRREGEKPVRTQQSKQRKFYLTKNLARSRASGWQLVNPLELASTGQPGNLAAPDRLNRGFRDYPVRHRFRVSTRLGHKLSDIEPAGDYWLVSDRAKAVLTNIGTEDFQFLAVDTEFDPGQEPMVLWLCEIIPVLDAVDEARSQVDVTQSTGGFKVHLVSGISRLTFDEAVVGRHHAFRLTTNTSVIVLDDAFREAIKRAGLTGLSFRDASKPL